jgi:xanthine dehydrogenase accessory factor
MKIGDVDARIQRENCFTISDKSLAIGGGALEAILTWMSHNSASRFL